MVSFCFYQNTHGDNSVEVKHCESNVLPYKEIQLKHRAQRLQPNSKWRRTQGSLEWADCKLPIAALLQEVQKALMGCSCDPEKSWTSQSRKEELSPIMLWNVHFCPEVCWQPHLQGKKVLLQKDTCALYLMPTPVPKTQRQLPTLSWLKGNSQSQ